MNALKLNFTQEQFDALVSLTFNIGAGNLKKYWADILSEDKDCGAIYDKFMAWVKETDPNTGEKITLPGLVKRRTEEAELYFS